MYTLPYLNALQSDTARFMAYYKDVFMITEKELRKTRKLIDRYAATLLEDTPQLLKLWGKEKVKDVVTNYLLMEAFKRLNQSSK